MSHEEEGRRERGGYSMNHVPTTMSRWIDFFA